MLDLLNLGKETTCLGGFLQVACPLTDGGAAVAEGIDEVGGIGTRHHDDGLSLHVVDQHPGRFERGDFRGDELVDAEFVVLAAAGAYAHRSVVAEDQAGAVALAPFAEDPGVFEPALLVADQFDALGFTGGECASVGVTGEDFLAHLLQFGFGDAAQRIRIDLHPAATTGNGQQVHAKQKDETAHILQF